MKKNILSAIFTNESFIRFIKYTLVGTCSSTLDVGGLYVLVQYGHVSVLVAATISYIVTAFIGYLLNRIWTFKSNDTKYEIQFVKYLTVSLIGLLFNNITMFILIDVFNVWYIFSKIYALLVVLIWTYWGNNKWTFKSKNR